MTSANPLIKAFFDSATSTISYIVYDKVGGNAAIIDSVLDFDAKAGRINTTQADKIRDFIVETQLSVEWILETHVHADHLSAAYYLRTHLGGKIAISKHIEMVQKNFIPIFNLLNDSLENNTTFDHLFDDDEKFTIGSLEATALAVPGHTPADLAYQIGDAIFVGDSIFMPDVGTARCDFPGGDAHKLYASVQKLLAFPANTRLFMCHDYPPSGRSATWETTVGKELESNIHVKQGTDEATFVNMRTARDATLSMPVLILPSIQVNIRAGELPSAEANGISYLKIPVNQF